MLVRLYVGFISEYNDEIEPILVSMNDLAKVNEQELFVKQIRLLQSIKGAGFLTAATIMCEIGDFSVFNSPNQLFTYFGLDPEIKQSGNLTLTMISRTTFLR